MSFTQEMEEQVMVCRREAKGERCRQRAGYTTLTASITIFNSTKVEGNLNKTLAIAANILEIISKYTGNTVAVLTSYYHATLLVKLT